MKFRPCIDIHNGKVKQIIGSSLQDDGNQAKENFVAEHDAAYYAKLYEKENLPGGHVILLNALESQYYEETKSQALAALRAYPGGLQIGGGITTENAAEYLQAGGRNRPDPDYTGSTRYRVPTLSSIGRNACLRRPE